MASPEQGESAAGSPHSTPVPEEMDFDLFGPSSESPSAQPPTTAAQVPREWKCADGCTCSASGSADAHFGCGPTAAVDVADAEQPEHSTAATAESDELSDASSECSVDSFEPSFGRRRSQTKG